MCGEGLGFERQACKGAPHKEQKFVLEGYEKRDELDKDGADADVGEMAAFIALTIQQLRQDIYASIEYAVRVHPQIED